MPPEDHPELPVVILEVQMFPKSLFFRRVMAAPFFCLIACPA